MKYTINKKTYDRLSKELLEEKPDDQETRRKTIQNSIDELEVQ